MSVISLNSVHTSCIGGGYSENAGALQSLGERADVQERDGSAGW